MGALTYLLSVALLSCIVRTYSVPAHRFEEFKGRYGRSYTSADEEEQRLGIFTAVRDLFPCTISYVYTHDLAARS